MRDGGELSATERKSIVAMHPEFSRWDPDYTGWWARKRVIRHVCLRCCGVGSLSMGYEVFVFDEEGKVLEANFMDIPNSEGSVRPKVLLEISPLRIKAVSRDTGWVTGPFYSHDEGRRKIVEKFDYIAKARLQDKLKHPLE